MIIVPEGGDLSIYKACYLGYIPLLYRDEQVFLNEIPQDIETFLSVDTGEAKDIVHYEGQDDDLYIVFIIEHAEEAYKHILWWLKVHEHRANEFKLYAHAYSEDLYCLALTPVNDLEASSVYYLIKETESIQSEGFKFINATRPIRYMGLDPHAQELIDNINMHKSINVGLLDANDYDMGYNHDNIYWLDQLEIGDADDLGVFINSFRLLALMRGQEDKVDRTKSMLDYVRKIKERLEEE